MALDRIVDRVRRWLEGTVRRIPESSGGPATLIQVCSDAKRNTAAVIALVELGGTEGDAAELVAAAVSQHAEDVTSRGMTFYLYALNATEKVLLAAFPVKVVAADLTSELAPSSAAVTPSSGANAPLVGDALTRAAMNLLQSERGYSRDLAQQNLDTLKASAETLSSVQQLQAKTAEIVQQQANALLDQLRLANERITELTTALRSAEREREEFRKQAADNLSLAEQAITKAEQLEKDKGDRESGPIAQLKKELIVQVSRALLPGVSVPTDTSSAAAIDTSSTSPASVPTDTSQVNGVPSLVDVLSAETARGEA